MTSGPTGQTAGDRELDLARRVVLAELAEVLDRPGSTIDLDADLDAGLDCDSLDVLEAVERVEQTLRGQGEQVSVPDEALAEVRTVGDVVRVVAARLGRGG